MQKNRLEQIPVPQVGDRWKSIMYGYFVEVCAFDFVYFEVAAGDPFAYDSDSQVHIAIAGHDIPEESNLLLCKNLIAGGVECFEFDWFLENFSKMEMQPKI